MRVDWKPGTLIYPLPAVLISCGTMEYGGANILTASWVSTACTNPPMCVVGIRPERHSHSIIKEHGAFGINLSTVSMARETDWCGVVSGRREDKFVACGFTKEAGTVLGVPLIEESPISLECRVREITTLGSHDLFLADIVGVRADEQYIDPETGAFDMKRAGLLVYAHGEYFGLGEYIGHFGWSVRKKKTKRR